jgi:hypothetical protein
MIGNGMIGNGMVANGIAGAEMLNGRMFDAGLVGMAVNQAAPVQSLLLFMQPKSARTIDAIESTPFQRLLADRMISGEPAESMAAQANLVEQARPFSERGLLRGIAVAAPSNQDAEYVPTHRQGIEDGALKCSNCLTENGKPVHALDMASGRINRASAHKPDSAGVFSRSTSIISPEISGHSATNPLVTISPIAAKGGLAIADRSTKPAPMATEGRQSVTIPQKLSAFGSALPFALLTRGEEGLSISLATYRFSQIERARLRRDIETLCLRFGHDFQLYFDGQQQSRPASGCDLKSGSGSILGAQQPCS